ncbi:O-succinylbenzoate synthase [Fodinibius salinus]|uniref:o-succinylbenzoate synthase n=1 Tax=Fodinibius salinus TaxID=860790 RepID=A0A5D3YNN5_9BACT|nr:o-succinylbenzoate synthase [Fodinibius salinus]TYP95292.1 O-succinylbenzoate synthase [Fodinibius salinus]
MLKAFKYNIPFTSQLETSNKTYSHRRGLILELRINECSYYAEAAPLPGFSSELVDDILRQISQQHQQIQAAFNYHYPTDKLNHLYQDQDIFPALAFALDTLACQIENEHQEQSLSAYLFDDCQPELPVNALGTLNGKNDIQKIKTIAKQGYKTVKFKIGTDFDHEFQALQKIRSSFPALNIRLDANRAWELEEAVNNCKQLESLDIEYCEEPLKEVSVSGFKKLTKNTNLPLAIDESVTTIPFWHKLLPTTSFVVVKPMVIGQFATIFDIYKQVKYHQNELIFTSSLELIIGRIMTAILAMGLGSQTHAHGLGTAKLLADDLQSNSYITNGIFSLPKEGMAININTEKLEGFSTYNFNNGK